MDNKLVFIVDDEIAIAEAYAATVQSVGLEPQMVHHGRVAQARLKEIVPALVILDLNLPGVSGRELLYQIRADPRLAQTRVLITSADTQTATAIANEGKADIILVKPVSQEQLRTFALRLRGGPAPASGAEGQGPA
jgi:DNA-binding response OmpR family regulator